LYRSAGSGATGCYDGPCGKTLLTVEQFEHLPEEESRRYELVHGELVEVSCPTFQHNDIRGIIEHALRAFLRAHHVGRVIAKQEFRLDQDTVRRPDVAFWRAEAFSRIDKSKSIMDVVPDLIAEIVFSNDTAEQLMRKVDQFLAAGCQCIWVIYPVERKVLVYEPDDQVRVLGVGKNLEAPKVLAGFSLAVLELFQ
jgi:Uma2 family endonuclease